MLKRCNYCMILIIFIVNTFEFVYFVFKSGDSHEGRQRLLVLLSPGGIRIEQFVTQTVVVSACRAITFMSAL